MNTFLRNFISPRFYSSFVSQKMEKKILRMGFVQSSASKDKKTNLCAIEKNVKELIQSKCDVIVLPECFNSPYGTEFFDEYAENIPDGETSQFLRNLAQENQVFIVGGSIPERNGSDLFNTCTVWSPDGNLIGQHRKIHLFDIDIPNGIKFQESKILKAGNKLTTFDIDKWRFGIGICYDLRFEELARLYRLRGCHVLLYPGAFNLTTGPLHWELLLRGRSVDNQVYTAGISGAYDENASYKAWGHSTVVDPLGKIVAKAERTETVQYADLDMDLIEKVRQQIPVFGQRRVDLYDTVEK